MERRYTEGCLYACKAIRDWIDKVTDEYEYGWDVIKLQIGYAISENHDNHLVLVEEYGESFVYGYNELLIGVKNKDIPQIEGLFKDWNQE